MHVSFNRITLYFKNGGIDTVMQLPHWHFDAKIETVRFTVNSRHVEKFTWPNSSDYVSDTLINIPLNGFLVWFEVNGSRFTNPNPPWISRKCITCYVLAIVFIVFYILSASHIKWLNVNCRSFFFLGKFAWIPWSCSAIKFTAWTINKSDRRICGQYFRTGLFVHCICGKNLKFVFHHSIWCIPYSMRYINSWKH